MNMWITYGLIAVILVIAELVYFRIADKCNIIDKPNERSSHSTIVLRGGGIIFAISILVWYFWFMIKGEGCMVEYLPLIVGMVLAAGVSFVDDIRSLPDSVRLVIQFAAMIMILYPVCMGNDFPLWQNLIILVVALIVSVGGTNIFNFMDGINGITGGYSIAVLIPLAIKNEELKVKSGAGFIDDTMLIVILLSVLVFCFFNFRQKAKCFAGDVGSIGMALILVFCIGRLMYVTGDITWIVLYLIYGADGMMTIFHRIMLHENLGEAHRKHAYQLMANELKMPHIVVSSIYMVLQLVISLIAIYVIPDTVLAHWAYLIVAAAMMGGIYILFMAKYYHLHESYLASLGKKGGEQ